MDEKREKDEKKKMDEKKKYLVEGVLKSETNTFLDEIERLMMQDGVGKILSKKDANKDINPPGRTQFKTLMDAAGQASCIEELLLFLAYQESKGGWKKKCDNGRSIAANVANSFMEIQEKILKEIEKKMASEKITEDDKRLLQLKIAKKYMGYLYWKASAAGAD